MNNFSPRASAGRVGRATNSDLRLQTVNNPIQEAQNWHGDHRNMFLFAFWSIVWFFDWWLCTSVMDYMNGDWRLTWNWLHQAGRSYCCHDWCPFGCHDWRRTGEVAGYSNLSCTYPYYSIMIKHGTNWHIDHSRPSEMWKTLKCLSTKGSASEFAALEAFCPSAGRVWLPNQACKLAEIKGCFLAQKGDISQLDSNMMFMLKHVESLKESIGLSFCRAINKLWALEDLHKHSCVCQ